MKSSLSREQTGFETVPKGVNLSQENDFCVTGLKKSLLQAKGGAAATEKLTLNKSKTAQPTSLSSFSSYFSSPLISTADSVATSSSSSSFSSATNFESSSIHRPSPVSSYVNSYLKSFQNFDSNLKSSLKSDNESFKYLVSLFSNPKSGSEKGTVKNEILNSNSSFKMVDFKPLTKEMTIYQDKEMTICHNGFNHSLIKSNYNSEINNLEEEVDEFQYGPGIVDKLRSKFLKYSLEKSFSSSSSLIKRCSSLEDLAGIDKDAY